MLILAIDDEPARYDYLRVLLERRGVAFRVACCSRCIAAHLPNAIAVLLDYDLDSGDLCTCGDWPEQVKGLAYLPALIAHGTPVLISSCSAPENRLALSSALSAAGIPAAQLPAWEAEVELRWLGRLWAWGVL